MSQSEKIDIDRLCQLARLALPEAEKEKLRNQVGDILAYVEKLKEVDIDGVEPMAHAMPLKNVWRDDEPRPWADPDRLLENAPEVRDHQIVVPKVIE